MSGNKVKFHPLERLDLIDINALQDYIYEQMELSLGVTLGAESTSKAGGLLRINGVTYNEVNSSIIPGDLIFAASSVDSDLTNIRPIRIGYMDAQQGGNSVVTYLNSKNAAQIYYNSNGTLPPSPGSASYSVATHGSYYPRVYARTYRADGVTDTRRFWNVANNAEESSNVNTLQRQLVSFLTISDGATPPAVSGDSSAWVEIFQIAAWQVSGGIVTRPVTLFYNYLVDNFLQQDSTNTYNKLTRYTGNEGIIQSKGGGLGAGLSILHSYINRERTQGSNDSAVPAAYSVDTVDTGSLPKYSLDAIAGLLDATGDAQHTADCVVSYTVQINNDLQCLFSHNVQHLRADGVIATAYSTDRISSPEPTGLGDTVVPVRLYRDMTLYESLGYSVQGDVIEVEEPQSAPKFSAFVGGWFVSVPAEYNGWGVSVNMVGCRSSVSSGILNVNPYASTGDSLTQHLRVSSRSVPLPDGTTETLYGFRLTATDARNIITDFSTNPNGLDSRLVVPTITPGSYAYSFKLSIVLKNPGAVKNS